MFASTFFVVSGEGGLAPEGADMTSEAGPDEETDDNQSGDESSPDSPSDPASTIKQNE